MTVTRKEAPMWNWFVPIAVALVLVLGACSDSDSEVEDVAADDPATADVVQLATYSSEVYFDRLEAIETNLGLGLGRSILRAHDVRQQHDREQAERGDPEAGRGLELIEQDRWPSSGRPRGRGA